MSETDLNIDRNIRVLVVKALSRERFKKDAAKLLCIGEKTLYKMIERFEIKQVNGKWQ